jgi:magnesium chelatase family protein
VQAAELRPDAAPGESSGAVRERVAAARSRQVSRCGLLNSQMGHSELLAHCRLSTREQTLLESAVERLQLSARASQRILRVARTVADLAGAEAIAAAHLAEAIGYRRMDKRS